MKILLANKFHYPRGGDCIHSMGLEKLLRDAGHEVAFFASKHPQNVASEWQSYWVSEFSKKKILRPFGDSETRRKFTRLLNDFKPDVVHLHNIHTQISPVVAELAHERGIRVVWTLHDYKLVCPDYLCYTHGKPCEKCITGDKSFCRKNRCMKGSFLQSLVAQKEAECWNRERLEACVDAFICPSEFMKRKMLQGGFEEKKLHVMHNFVVPFDYAQGAMDISGIERSRNARDYYAYIGRLSEEKGIRTLLRVAAKLSYKLKVLGAGPLESELKALYTDKPQIEFLGHCNREAVIREMVGARFTVVPSEWYEVFGLSVVESMSVGTPVLAAKMGGIPELVAPGVNGELFEAGDEDGLGMKITEMFEKEYGFEGKLVAERFSPSKYLEGVLGVYGGAA
ncbi:MAG: glycosyltransferase [Verrucomicrobiota bacterium]|jgi:glycosyltransferase involved in cell wall biosynthesis|nr:glycosyltransferase [Verrucomicrobiota bacterium]